MKLALDTYSIDTDLTLRDIVELLPANGFEGVEFRCEAGQKHGVEPEIPKQERRRILTFLNNAGLDVTCLSTSQRFEYPDLSERQRAIERSKQFIDLAADLNCPGIRVFGNDFPPGIPKMQVVQYVGESLAELGGYAEGSGVDI